MNELVSIVIPNYNREQLIEKAINSCLEQSYKNIEIIIVDDNSNDNSRDVIVEISKKDSRIRYKFLNENHGANHCRNIGIDISEGDYIAFLDSDDEFVRDKIERQLVVFNNEQISELVAIVFTAYSINSRKIKGVRSYDDYIELKDIMFRNNLGGFSTCMVRKNIFNKIGKLNTEMPSCQDWEFYIRVLVEYKGYYIKESKVNYYLQDDSITNNYEKVIRGHERVFSIIMELNDTIKCVDMKELERQQHILLGDINLRFYNISRARSSFINGIKIRFDIRILLRIIKTYLGKNFLKYSINLRRKIKQVIKYTG